MTSKCPLACGDFRFLLMVFEWHRNVCSDRYDIGQRSEVTLHKWTLSTFFCSFDRNEPLERLTTVVFLFND
jgi:hypothetical protein